MWETVWGKDTCFRRGILESLRRGRTYEQRLKEDERRGKRGGKASLQGQGLKTASVQGQNALDIFKQEKGDPCGWNRRREGRNSGKPGKTTGSRSSSCAPPRSPRGPRRYSNVTGSRLNSCKGVAPALQCNACVASGW